MKVVEVTKKLLFAHGFLGRGLVHAAQERDSRRRRRYRNALALAAVLFVGLAAAAAIMVLEWGGKGLSLGAWAAGGQGESPPTRYVDGALGLDSNPGTSDRPWKTIQKAANWASTARETGATIHVRAGSYPQRVHVGGGGSAEAPVVFEASGRVITQGFTIRADYVTVRGFEITDTPDVWDDGVGLFVEGSHCLLEDNYVHFATRGGILLFGNQGKEDGGTGCVVRSNRLYRNALMGIEINGRNHVIEGNEIWGTIQYHPKWANPPEWVDADGIRFFGSGHVIRDNWIHHISYADRENVDPHIDCFQTWGPAYDIGFYRNRCNVLEYQSRDERGKGFMIEEAYAPVRDLTITNNVIQAFNHVTAIDAENLTIVNNTFVGNPAFPAWALGAVEFFGSPGATVQNNVFYNVQTEPVAADPASRQGLTANHNAVYRSDGGSLSGIQARGDVWNVDLELRNPDQNDFRPRAGSPLIDAGAAVDVPRDVTGSPRPAGEGYDIGAYEYQPGAASGGAAATLTPTPSPTLSTPQVPTATATRKATPTPTERPTRTPPATPEPTDRPTRTPSATPEPTRTPTPTLIPGPGPATPRARPTPGID